MAHPRLPRGLAVLACLTLAAAGGARPALAQQQEQAGGASEVFRRFAGQVAKVEISETSSGAKSSLGSGFYAGADGLLVTNYHVVSSLVTDPGRYRVDVIDETGGTSAARIVAIDVVHDLAVLSTSSRPATWFSLGAPGLPQGTRLFALGHPSDLGLTIVEGTYNGLLKHSLYDRIHFTGSINSGMSGGPTITPRGEVVGVNVSTAGNQLSFLVPVARVTALLERARAPRPSGPAPALLPQVGRQILAHQQSYLAGMLERSPTVALGRYVLPTRPAPFFKCWADVTTDDEDPYTIVDHQCSTDDRIFIAGTQSSGVMSLRHRLVTTTELNRIRFASLLQFVFEPGDEAMGGDERFVTSFRCATRNVASAAGGGAGRVRAAVCLRRYRKLDGLYDAVVKTVTLGGAGSGVVSTLSLSGVSFETAQALAGRFVGSVRWKP